MKINETCEGLHFGYGLFETLLYVKGEFRYMMDHYQRLTVGLQALAMAPVAYETFEKALMDHDQKHRQPVVKVTCIKEGDQTRLLVTSRVNPYRDDHYRRGYKAGKSVYPKASTDGLLQHKTCNCMNNLLEKKSLAEAGLDESVHFNENLDMTEGVFCNIFFVKDCVIYTPDLACGLLAGVQRKNVIRLIKKLGLCLEIGYYKEEALLEADEVFYTNAVIGIMPLLKYENQNYDLNQNHITRRLMKEYGNGLL